MMPGRKRLQGSDVLVRDADELLTTVVDGELVALSIDKGACYGLNDIGTRIWDLIAEPRSVEGLCEQLEREFEVEATVCRREVLDFLDQLQAEGIVRVSAAG